MMYLSLRLRRRRIASATVALESRTSIKRPGAKAALKLTRKRGPKGTRRLGDFDFAKHAAEVMAGANISRRYPHRVTKVTLALLAACPELRAFTVAEVANKVRDTLRRAV